MSIQSLKEGIIHHFAHLTIGSGKPLFANFLITITNIPLKKHEKYLAGYIFFLKKASHYLSAQKVKEPYTYNIFILI